MQLGVGVSGVTGAGAPAWAEPGTRAPPSLTARFVE